MTTSRERQRWLQAGITLAKSPDEAVDCPACQRAKLRVFDVPHGETDRFSRYITCDRCGAYEILLMLGGRKT